MKVPTFSAAAVAWTGVCRLLGLLTGRSSVIPNPPKVSSFCETFREIQEKRIDDCPAFNSGLFCLVFRS